MLHAEHLEAARHGRDTVTFLHTQFFGAGDERFAFCARGGNEQRRELVDRQRHEPLRDARALEPRRPHLDVGHGLPAKVAVVDQAQVRAHQRQHFQDAGTRRVHADISNRERLACAEARCHQEECRGRDIARHANVRRLQRLRCGKRHHAVACADLATEALQHALGVIARDSRLDHRGLTCRVQTRQQHRGFHLRAGHGHLVADPLQRLATVNSHRRLAVMRFDAGAHGSQRLRHALHRAAHQRGVTDQFGIERLRAEQAHEEAHRRACITHVERGRGRVQTLQADAIDDDFTGTRSFDVDAEMRDRLHGGKAVFAFQKSRDARPPFRQRAEHDSAVRDRLVARDRDLPGDTVGRVDDVGRHFRELPSDRRRRRGTATRDA